MQQLGAKTIQSYFHRCGAVYSRVLIYTAEWTKRIVESTNPPPPSFETVARGEFEPGVSSLRGRIFYGAQLDAK